MSQHDFTREQLVGDPYPGAWDVNNPRRVDGEGDQIHLAFEVRSALPGKTFRMRCSGALCRFEFDQDLTAPEIATLDVTVAAHKTNT